MIELRSVDRSFGGQAVLADLSIAVHPGETLAIIGESGCGKSVTTKLMAGLIEPSAGAVYWKGRDIQTLGPSEIRRQRVKLGYLFQGAALFDSMTVYENVAFGLRENATLSEAEVREIVSSHLVEVGLPAATALKRPADLSGGMRKRVGLARALALAPDVMIYDEPTTGLDPVMSDVINELILHTRQRRPVTSIVVTHDMHTVRRVADRVVMLYPLSRLQGWQSQILFEGTADEAFAARDPRVRDFVEGRAGERLKELFAA